MPSDDFWADLPHRFKPSVAPPPAVVKSPASGRGSQRPDRWTFRRWLTAVVLTSLLSALAVAVAFGLLLYEGVGRAANPAATESVQFTIERGQSARLIASRLETAGLIISRWPLLAYLRYRHLELRAGVYRLSANQTTQAIADQIATGDVAEHRLTIPEGWRREQIADQLAAAGIVERATFLAATNYDPVRDVLPPGLTLPPGASLEGLLFPDTYIFPYGVTSKEIVATLLANFTRRTADLDLTYADVVLASIVEREASRDDDRPQVAGVYRNRLAINQRLDADPTVQYAKDSAAAAGAAGGGYHWWGAITAADYQAVKSPYNTYRELGLPPSPIANPGLKALTAAKQPASHPYYYFLHGPDGTTYFSKTLDEHNRRKQQL